MANVLLLAFALCFRFRATSTGHGALRTTRSAVLPSKKMLQSAVSSRRKHDQIGINFAGQTDNLLVRLPATYVAILRTKCRHMFLVNSCQFLVKPFNRFG